MFITKMSLPRRTILRGVGATLALPLLDAMVPALSPLVKTAAKPVRRAAFVYIPNGAIMDAWTPKGEGPNFQFSPALKSLEPFRDRLTVISGLGHPMAESMGDGAGDHPRSSAVFLSGVHPKRTEGVDVRGGMTVDQILAQHLGQTRLGSLELSLDTELMDVVGACDTGYSCSYVNTISWRTPTTPLPMEPNPRVVFERIFGEGDTSAERRAEQKVDASILDRVAKDLAGLQHRLGHSDRVKLAEYLDSVRDVERRIQFAEKSAELSVAAPEAPVGVPDNFTDHANLMYDLLALAFQTDASRVATFLVRRETNDQPYPQIGVPEPHHSLSHHQYNPVKIEKLVKINTYHVQLFSDFLKRLRATPDGDGTLLDHSMILYGGAMSDSQVHSHAPLPILVAGAGAGQLKGGQHFTYPVRTPMTQLLLTLLDKAGAPSEGFSAATGVSDRLPGI